MKTKGKKIPTIIFNKFIKCMHEKSSCKQQQIDCKLCPFYLECWLITGWKINWCYILQYLIKASFLSWSPSIMYSSPYIRDSMVACAPYILRPRVLHMQSLLYRLWEAQLLYLRLKPQASLSSIAGVKIFSLSSYSHSNIDIFYCSYLSLAFYLTSRVVKLLRNETQKAGVYITWNIKYTCYPIKHDALLFVKGTVLQACNITIITRSRISPFGSG